MDSSSSNPVLSGFFAILEIELKKCNDIKWKGG